MKERIGHEDGYDKIFKQLVESGYDKWNDVICKIRIGNDIMIDVMAYCETLDMMMWFNDWYDEQDLDTIELLSWEYLAEVNTENWRALK